MRSSISDSGVRPDALIIRMRNTWFETHAIFVDFTASASPGLRDKRKRLPGARVPGRLEP